MSFHEDLLDHAKGLIASENGEPRQVDLKRAVSAAYYALFHLLVEEATRMMIADPRLQTLVRRAFSHAEMKQVALAFEAANPKQAIQAICGDPVPDGLREVARAFIKLQEHRINADYRVDAPFSNQDATKAVDLAEKAFEQWDQVKNEPISRIFLAALLLQKQWGSREQ